MQNKIHNRTLFVAALSVYFGLLIVGAPPQVLAQTALTQVSEKTIGNSHNANCLQADNAEVAKLFDIDLAQRLIELTKTTFVRLEIVKSENQHVNGDAFWYKKSFSAPYTNRNGELVQEWLEAEDSGWASAAHAGQIVELDGLFERLLEDCSFNKKFYKQQICREINFRLDSSELRLEVSILKISDAKANQLAENLNQVFILQACRTKELLAKQIYENTIASVQNNQVFIVTHLPRSALDSLFRAGEKAN